MKFIKRGLAALLAALLVIPAQPVMAAVPSPPEIVEEMEVEREENLSLEDEISEAERKSKKSESARGGSVSEGEISGEETLEEVKASEEEGAKENDLEEGDAKEDDSEEVLEKEKSEQDRFSEEKNPMEEKVLDEEREYNEEEEFTEEEELVGEGEPAGEEELVGEEELIEEKGISEKKETMEENEFSAETVKPNKAPKKQESSRKQDDVKETANSEEEEVFDEEILDEDEVLDEDKTLDEDGILVDFYLATASSARKRSVIPEDEVLFNTGSHVFSVVSKEDFEVNDLGDAFFEEDGSYTIHIPEENPFFPYEVQFTYKNKTSNEWFMTPEDSVTVGGHTFYVSAYFDDDKMVTQMSFEVAGETVVVYPEEKEFTDTDEDGIMPASLLPLEERKLKVDFRNYTPVELTMVSLDSIFTGENELKDTDMLLTYYDPYPGISTPTYDINDVGIDNRYVVNTGGIIDFRRIISCITSEANSSRDHIILEMIVGDRDQLSSSNIRYIMEIQITRFAEWILPIYYAEGIETDCELKELYYGTKKDLFYGSQGVIMQIPMIDGLEWGGLKINTSIFSTPLFDHLDIFEGRLELEELEDSMSPIASWEAGGYKAYFNIDLTTNQRFITMVSYDQVGNITGILPILLSPRRLFHPEEDRIDSYNLTDPLNGRNPVLYDVYSEEYDDSNGYEKVGRILELYKGYSYAPDKEYYLVLRHTGPSSVTAAYVGEYMTIKEARAAGAKDIKDKLFDNGVQGGYLANYSKGVCFSIFLGEDGSKNQKIYHYSITTRQKRFLPYGTELIFEGLNDAKGRPVDCYVIDVTEDSYAEYAYRTILVGPDVDVTKLAPTFHISQDAALFASGGIRQESSGKSFHDFSQGAIEYTVSVENGTDAKNYWLQVVKATEGKGWLYINSLEDENAKTREEGGIIYSTREIFLDSAHGWYHSILLANMGTEEISNLSVELKSDTVELDEYWTLSGNYGLSGFSTANKTTEYGGLQNLAKIRLGRKNDYSENENQTQEITGTLTIKSGNDVLMVLTLTGTVGEPGITTSEIPNAVKYVPYGTMIQNNNKYSWNSTSYKLENGELPEGIMLKENGELYGVPMETGTFTFTVSMKNSYEEFSSSGVTFTLTVTENTDANVEAATDAGYELIQRIPDISVNPTGNYTVVSQGAYEEFVDAYIDGVKLIKGEEYTSEAGSTRITIGSQTLKRFDEPGNHTLGIEFRTSSGALKRAAQNYTVKARATGSSHSGGGGGGGGSSSGGSTNTGLIHKDPKRGYVHAQTGIIINEADGYSRWQQDENGWKLKYADGTMASGHMTDWSDGTTVEQVVWELIGGAWYAFGIDEYLKSGWVYDYQIGDWYWVSVDTGMLSGWNNQSQDGFTYYMDPATGKIGTGWWKIEDKWYYFNHVVSSPTWYYDERTGKWLYDMEKGSQPYGSLYMDRRTPDGYYVDANGVWDGQDPQ